MLNEIGSKSDDGEIGFEDFVSIMTCKISAEYKQEEIKKSFHIFAKGDVFLFFITFNYSYLSIYLAI